MSTKSHERNLLSTYIKLENDTDDELSELNHQTDCYSLSTNLHPSLSLAYKGKIEVTSKGRRKIFDGVRWQILCRRADCRKQTNKKSLCITHYKEEYESNIRLSSSWSNNVQSLPLQVPSYQQRKSSDNTKSRLDIEDQNNTITTTDRIDNDEQILFNASNNRSVHDGFIKCLHNGRRFILKDSKWQPLCKYDNICRQMGEYELLCSKHHELTEGKRRDTSKISHNTHRRSHASIFDKYHSIFPKDSSKRLKTNNFQISSSSVTEQFDINSNENNYTAIEPIDKHFSSVTSKLPDHQIKTSSKKILNIPSSDSSSSTKQTSTLTIDQSVQTDLTIPLCCIIHQENHSIYSSCQTHLRKCTSSILSYDTKPEPKPFDTMFSI